MKFGLQISPYHAGSTGNPWDSVQEIAKYADESAFDSLWLYDHFLYEGGLSAHPFSEPVMECFTMLGAVAAVTQKIHLGPLVAGIPFRNPAMLTKMATTLDYISQGRLILGLGASWHNREYKGYGWGELESPGIRINRLEEALQVIFKLWTEQPADFQGAYYRLENVHENPRPIQKPVPPILIGGNGEKGTLRLVAQYAQFCNVWGEPAKVKHLFEVLGKHCERLKRPYDEITRSILATVIVGKNNADVVDKCKKLNDYIPWKGEITIIGTPDQVIKEILEYQNVGCQYLILRMPDWIDIDPVRLFAEKVIPVLTER